MVVMCRTSKKSNIEIELMVDSAGQQTVRNFTVMFSSTGAAEEFRKLFKQVS